MATWQQCCRFSNQTELYEALEREDNQPVAEQRKHGEVLGSKVSMFNTVIVLHYNFITVLIL